MRKGRLRIRRKFVITTYEDPLRYFDSLYTNQIEGVNSNKIVPIIVIRDIYNNSASRLKFDGRRKKSQPPGWYDESLNHWRDLFLTKLFGKSFVEINYNRWLLSKVYRLRMARCLKLPNNDGHLNTTIHNFGGGSSFTGTRATAKQKMLLRRWEMYIEEFGITPTFQKILNDDELREMNLLFFGWALNKKGGNNQMKQESPFAIQIELTEGCNLFCSFCGIHGIRSSAKDYEFMKSRIQQTLSLSKLQKDRLELPDRVCHAW
jgi:hypothetical protein